MGRATLAFVPTTETGALTSIQFVEPMSVISWSTQGVGLVDHSSVCEFKENEAMRMFGGAGMKFATSERFNVTGN